MGFHPFIPCISNLWKRKIMDPKDVPQGHGKSCFFPFLLAKWNFMPFHQLRSHLPETSAIPFGVAVGRDAISPDTIEKTSPSLRIQVTTPQVILSNLEANPISIHVHVIFTYMGVSKNRGGPPKWMVKIMENPIKMGWFGGKTHYFRKHPHLVDFYGSYGCRSRSDQCINAFFKASRSPQRAASNISSVYGWS